MRQLRISRYLVRVRAALIGVGLVLSLAGGAFSQTLPAAASDLAQPNFPGLIRLPTGFGPEGLAAGLGTSFYTGSLSGH